MKDANTLVRDSIQIGIKVKIALHENQKPAEYEEGIIKDVLSEEKFDEKGIEVELESGYIGHVKEIISKSSTEEEIVNRIKQRENKTLEKKETFSYDVKEERKNDELKKVVCIAVASLMNTNGGYLYIGVNDDCVILGLERDYSLISDGDNDKLERQIRDALRKNLSNYVTVTNFIEIDFPKVEDIEICEIKVKPSSEPIFLEKKSNNVIINGKTTQRNFDDFYIRDGNGKKLLETNDEFLRYWKQRFQTLGN